MVDAAAQLMSPEGTRQPVRIEEARQRWAMTAAAADLPPEEVASARDIRIDACSGRLPARVYRGVDCADQPPLLVWYHGGAWVIGDLSTADRICRRIANRVGAVVISVEYRLAPEHPAPAATEDAWDALLWSADHAAELGADPNRLAVGGDSAGGNLAALMALRARQEARPSLAYQLLVYPALDLSRSAASHAERALPLFDPQAADEWYGLYLGGADPRDPSLSPAAVNDLSRLPPGCVVTAGYDPLRDEGHDFVARLRGAGVEVEHLHYPSMMHGFIQLGAITECMQEATDAMCAHMRRTLDQGG